MNTDLTDDKKREGDFESAIHKVNETHSSLERIDKGERRKPTRRSSSSSSLLSLSPSSTSSSSSKPTLLSGRYRVCKLAGCSGRARKKGVCGRHGGRDKCSVADCDRIARGRLKLCFAHMPKEEKKRSTKSRRSKRKRGSLLGAEAAAETTRNGSALLVALQEEKIAEREEKIRRDRRERRESQDKKMRNKENERFAKAASPNWSSTTASSTHFLVSLLEEETKPEKSEQWERRVALKEEEATLRERPSKKIRVGGNEEQKSRLPLPIAPAALASASMFSPCFSPLLSSYASYSASSVDYVGGGGEAMSEFVLDPGAVELLSLDIVLSETGPGPPPCASSPVLLLSKGAPGQPDEETAVAPVLWRFERAPPAPLAVMTNTSSSSAPEAMIIKSEPTPEAEGAQQEEGTEMELLLADPFLLLCHSPEEKDVSASFTIPEPVLPQGEDFAAAVCVLLSEDKEDNCEDGDLDVIMSLLGD